MSTIRIAERERFTIIANLTVTDKRLSFRARGVLTWLLSKPDDWRCNAEAIARDGTEGRDAIRTALSELEACGYLVRVREQVPETGQWRTRVDVYERPITEDGKPGVGKPAVGKPAVGKPAVGKPGVIQRTETEGLREKTETKDGENSSAAEPAENLELVLADGAPPPGERDRFEEFWAIYPRTKVGKADARNEWKRAIKKTSPDVIIAAAVARGEYWSREKTEQNKRPYAARWLKREQWDDEIEPDTVQAAASAAQKLADHDQREKGELEAALARKDHKMATRIVIDHAEARGDAMFVSIAKRLLDGKSDEIIQAVVTVDGEPVTTDDIAHARAVLDEIAARCELSPQLER